MKVTKRKLIKLIKEAFIGQVGKPPVNVQSYLNNPEVHPKLAPLLQSQEPDAIRQGLSIHGSLTGDDMALAIQNASLEDESFLDKEKPLDKEKNRFAAVITQLAPMNLLRGKMFNEEFYITDYNDDSVSADFEVVIDGSIIDKIYGLLSIGRDSDAKKIGMNYFSDAGKFFTDNPHTYEKCKEYAEKYGAIDFGDLYYNYRIYSRTLEMMMGGLLPEDVDPWINQVSGIELSVGQFGELKEEVPASNADAKAKIFRLAKALGVLSRPFGEHPIGYFFQKPEGSSILKGHTEIRIEF